MVHLPEASKVAHPVSSAMHVPSLLRAYPGLQRVHFLSLAVFPEALETAILLQLSKVTISVGYSMQTFGEVRATILGSVHFTQVFVSAPMIIQSVIGVVATMQVFVRAVFGICPAT